MAGKASERLALTTGFQPAGHEADTALRTSEQLDQTAGALKRVAADLGMTGDGADAAWEEFAVVARLLQARADDFARVAKVTQLADSAMAKAQAAYQELPDGDLAPWQKAAIAGGGMVVAGPAGAVTAGVAAEIWGNEREQQREAEAKAALAALTQQMHAAQSAMPEVPPPPKTGPDDNDSYDRDPVPPTVPDDTSTWLPPLGQGPGSGPGGPGTYTPTGVVSGLDPIRSNGIPTWDPSDPRDPDGPRNTGDPRDPDDRNPDDPRNPGDPETPVTGDPRNPFPDGSDGRGSADGDMTGTVPGGSGSSTGGYGGSGHGAGGHGGAGGALAGSMAIGGAALGAARLGRGGAAGARGGLLGGLGSGGLGGAGGSGDGGSGLGARTGSGLGGSTSSSGLVPGASTSGAAGAGAGGRAGATSGMMPMGGSGAAGSSSKGRRGPGGYLAPDIEVEDEAGRTDLGKGARAGSRGQRAAPVEELPVDDETW